LISVTFCIQIKEEKSSISTELVDKILRQKLSTTCLGLRKPSSCTRL